MDPRLRDVFGKALRPAYRTGRMKTLDTYTISVGQTRTKECSTTWATILYPESFVKTLFRGSTNLSTKNLLFCRIVEVAFWTRIPHTS